MNTSQRSKSHQEALEAQRYLHELTAQGHRVLYVDEMMTTKSTIPTHEYSLKGQPIQVDYK